MPLKATKPGVTSSSQSGRGLQGPTNQGATSTRWQSVWQSSPQRERFDSVQDDCLMDGYTDEDFAGLYFIELIAAEIPGQPHRGLTGQSTLGLFATSPSATQQGTSLRTGSVIEYRIGVDTPVSHRSSASPRTTRRANLDVPNEARNCGFNRIRWTSFIPEDGTHPKRVNDHLDVLCRKLVRNEQFLLY